MRMPFAPPDHSLRMRRFLEIMISGLLVCMAFGLTMGMGESKGAVQSIAWLFTIVELSAAAWTIAFKVKPNLSTQISKWFLACFGLISIIVPVVGLPDGETAFSCGAIMLTGAWLIESHVDNSR